MTMSTTGAQVNVCVRQARALTRFTTGQGTSETSRFPERGTAEHVEDAEGNRAKIVAHAG